MKKFSALLLAAVMGSAITVGLVKITEDDSKDTLRIEYAENMPVVPAMYNEDGTVAPVDFTISAEKTMPAVVHIRNEQFATSTSREQQIPEQFREFFGPFLRPDGGGQARIGSGSGVIINSDGYIVTNNHVIANAEKISVTMNDNRSFTAKVIGTDPTTDLALIKVDGKNLPYLSLSNSEQVKVGEWVLAVGNPYNLNSTVTAGIVSAKGRSINILNTIQKGDSINNGIESFIQTDAAINPGNSGGALVNLNGDLIGVNTAIASPTGSYSGYGFAVPSNIVKRVIEDLMAYGTVQRGLMGVQITSVNAAVAENYNLDVLRGAYVSGVQPNTAASEAGLKEGDVIVEIDDREIASSSELIGYVAGKRPGDKIAVTVNRDGNEVDYDLILRNRKGTTEMLKKAEPEVLTSLGVELAAVSSAKLDALKLTNGVQVKELNEGKLRSETDIREGFIITRIDGKRVSSPKQVVDILKNKEGGVLIEGVYEGSSRVYYYGMGM